jgi:hypothetical protein
MFCPSCGAQNNTDQKFCRSCGMNLENSAASLLEQFPNSARADLKLEEKRLERFGRVAFTGLGICVGIAILAMIYFIFTKMVLSGEQPWSGALLISFIIFAGLCLGYVVWQESLKEKRAKIDMAPGRDIESTEPTGKLLDEGSFEPVPDSVVEDTTELLTTKSRTKKLDQ